VNTDQLLNTKSLRCLFLAGATPLVLVLILGLISCRTPVVEGQFKDKDQMSPGPAGWLTGEDLRIPIQWIVNSRTYGPGDYARKIKVDGRDRYYEVHVPPNYRPEEKIPVVLVLHGGGGFPGVARFMTGMSQLSDQTGGFHVIYPAGTNKRFSDRLLSWNAGWKHKDKKQRKVDDVKYFAAVLDDLNQHFAIN